MPNARDISSRLAAVMMNHRALSSVALLIVTLFFGWGLQGVELRTIFSDLLPKNHPFVQTYKDHPNFGNPLTVTVMIKAKEGDIYNPATLQKVWDITRDIDLAPGVDHDQILSVATEKARYSRATPFGIDSQPLMGDRAPESSSDTVTTKHRCWLCFILQSYLLLISCVTTYLHISVGVVLVDG